MQRVTKRLNLYRNGDPSFRPLSYLYNSQKIRTFNKLLEEFDEKVPPLRGGAVKYLYTADGEEKIQSIEQIIARDENELSIVVSGNEPYRPIKNGYENIGNRNQRNQIGNKQDESFLAKNRRMRRNQQGGTTQNNQKPPIVDANQIKRITLLRSGDPFFEPKLYLFRKRHTPSLEKFLEDVEKIVPPKDGGPARFIFNMSGEEIENLDDLKNGQDYVIAGEAGYVEPTKGFLSTEAGGRRSSVRSRSKSPGAQSQRSLRSPRRDLSTPIYTRPDQIQTESLFLFCSVFKNGNGLEAGRFIFSAKQLNRGMPWILEQIAKRWGVYPKRLASMDGGEVKAMGHLVHKGAYILVPLGENYRNTWYYLPEQAKDTSADSEDMKNLAKNGASPRTPRPAQRKKSIISRRHSDPSLSEDKEESGRDSVESSDSRTESRQNTPDEDRQNSDEDDHSYSDYSSEEDSDRSGSRESSVSHADTMTLDGNEDLDEDHHHHHHHKRHDHHHSTLESPPGRRRSTLGLERSTSALSQCSYCTMLEKHLEKHHGHSHHASPRVSPRSHVHSADSHRKGKDQSDNRSRVSYQDEDETDRKERLKSNVRSISPSPTRGNKSKKERRPSIASKRSKKKSSSARTSPTRTRKGNVKLSASENFGKRSPRSRQSIRRSNSDATVFYANKAHKSFPPTRMKTTSDYGENVFHAKSKRSETHGARAIKENRRTKTEIPLDHRKPRVVSVAPYTTPT